MSRLLTQFYVVAANIFTSFPHVVALVVVVVVVVFRGCTYLQCAMAISTSQILTAIML